MAEPGEALVAAAVRKLYEETGLQVAAVVLRPLGTHAYLREGPGAVRLDATVDAGSSGTAVLVAGAAAPSGISMPEIDRFGLFEFEVGLALVGRNLARVLTVVWPMINR